MNDILQCITNNWSIAGTMKPCSSVIYNVSVQVYYTWTEKTYYRVTWWRHAPDSFWWDKGFLSKAITNDYKHWVSSLTVLFLELRIKCLCKLHNIIHTNLQEHNFHPCTLLLWYASHSFTWHCCFYKPLRSKYTLISLYGMYL